MQNNKIKQLGILTFLITTSLVFASKTCQTLHKENCVKKDDPCSITIDGEDFHGVIGNSDRFDQCRDGSPGFKICIPVAQTNRCNFDCLITIINSEGKTNTITEKMMTSSTSGIVPDGTEGCVYPK